MTGAVILMGKWATPPAHAQNRRRLWPDGPRINRSQTNAQRQMRKNGRTGAQVPVAVTKRQLRRQRWRKATKPEFSLHLRRRK